MKLLRRFFEWISYHYDGWKMTRELRKYTLEQLLIEFKRSGYTPVRSGSQYIYTLRQEKTKVIITPTEHGYDLDLLPNEAYRKKRKQEKIAT